VTLRQLSVTAALVASSALVSPGASAGDKPVDTRLEEARKKLEEARKLLLKKKQELEGKGGASSTTTSTGGKKNEAAGGTGGKAPEKKDAKAGAGGKAEEKVTESKAEAALAELDRTRDERRRATVARLRARWGALLDSDAARQELKLHGERVARLARLRALAEEKKKLPLIETIDGLVT
jgi:hypothetical protein